MTVTRLNDAMEAKEAEYEMHMMLLDALAEVYKIPSIPDDAIKTLCRSTGVGYDELQAYCNGIVR